MPRRVKDPSYWHPVTVPWFNINCTKRLPLIGKYEILRSQTSALSGTGSRSRVRSVSLSARDRMQDIQTYHVPPLRPLLPTVRLRKMLSGIRARMPRALRTSKTLSYASSFVSSEFFPCAYLSERDPPASSRTFVRQKIMLQECATTTSVMYDASKNFH